MRARGLLLSLITFAFAASSFAYSTDGRRWTLNRTVVMHLALGDFVQLEDGFTSFNQSAEDALNTWNQDLVHMKFRPIVASQLPPGNDDADNSVFFSPTIYGEGFGRNTIAITLISSLDDVTETDVIFNSSEDWGSYRGPLRPDILDFHRVALHEFGHVLGLDHPDDAKQRVSAIMNSVVGNVDSLQPDDINGAKSLYDAGPPYLSGNPAANLVNLSTRAFIEPGAKVLIGGFIVQGSQPATVVLRAIGHSLAGSGVGNPLDDPMIELYDAGNRLITSNDDWFSGGDAETIASFHLDPTNSRESAILRTLPAGNYTVVVKAFDNGDGNLSGTGLVELYDLHTSGGRAGNLASRGQVLTGNDAMIAGFIVGGNQSKEVVVRGLGPSLADQQIADPLSDPMITLVNASGTAIASNDDWESDPNAPRVRSSGLAPTRGNESALYANLNPGSYTVVLRGFNNAQGIGLVEVYDLAPPPN